MSIFHRREIQWQILGGLVMLAAAVLIFYRLGDHPIYIWDEAIYANNALDMALSADPLVMRLNGETNFYNVKPSLSVWLQALFVRILGPTELAIRLPSALAAWGTCWAVMLFAWKALRSLPVGCLAVLTLATSQGFVRHHVARTGDLDAMLAFWVAFYGLFAIYGMLGDTRLMRKTYVPVTVGIILAFLSKSVAAFLPVPALVAVAAYNRKLGVLLRDRRVYISLGLAITFCAGYYALREAMSPGYFDVVVRTELMRYFKVVMHWHAQPLTFYLSNLVVRDFFMPHVLLAPFVIIFAVRITTFREAAISLLIFIASYYLVISIPTVKLEWYDAPCYPFTSLLWGIGIWNLMIWLGEKFGLRRVLMNVGMGLVLMGYFGYAASGVFRAHALNNGMPIDTLEREGYFMKELKSNYSEINNYTVLMDITHRGHLTQAQFYANAYRMSDAFSIDVSKYPVELDEGQFVMSCQPHIQSLLLDSLGGQVIVESDTVDCLLFRLGSDK